MNQLLTENQLKIEMKRVLLFTHSFSSFTQLATAQGEILKDCFGYSNLVGRKDIGKLVSNQSQILTNEFRYDMRLYKIISCLSNQNLTGLTFVLGSMLTSPVQTIELESLGYRYGSDCQEVTIPKYQSIIYIEVSYNSDKVTSLYAKRSDNTTNYLFGQRKRGDQIKSWSFNDENALTGLIGTEENGIASIGVVTYNSKCADQVLGFDVDPTNGNKNYIPGVYTQDEVNKDGTFQFATRPMRFKNPDVMPKRTAQRNIWSLENPNLVTDIGNWAMTSPNYYYWGSGALVIFMSILACICCCWQQGCCRRCCCQNKAKIGQDVSKNQEEGSNVEMFKKNIKTSAAVLDDQGTCEDIGDDEGLPTQRRLFTQETAANDGLSSHRQVASGLSSINDHKPPVATHYMISNPDQELSIRELEERKEMERRQILAEQIMYGSALTKYTQQDSEEGRNRFELGKLHNSKNGDNRLDSLLTPPDTRDSQRQVNPSYSYQQHISQMQMQQIGIQNEQMDAQINKSNSYMKTQNPPPKFEIMHDRPATQIMQKDLKRIPHENYQLPLSTQTDYSTEAGPAELFSGQVQFVDPYLNNQNQQATIQKQQKMQEGYISKPDLHNFESKQLWHAEMVPKPQVYTQDQQIVNIQGAQLQMKPLVRRESHLDRQVRHENYPQQQHQQQLQQIPLQPQYQQAQPQQILQAPQQRQPVHQSYQIQPSQAEFVDNVRPPQLQTIQHLNKHQPPDQEFVQNSSSSQLLPLHQIYQNQQPQIVFSQNEQHRSQPLKHEMVQQVDQPINHRSIQMPMSASLDASSIGRNSFPDTPNNLLSPQVEKLVSQVESLQKQLNQVQRQQTFRDQTSTRNLQNSQSQPSQITDDQMSQIQPPPIPQQQHYATHQVYENQNQRHESISPRGDFRSSSQNSYMEQIAQANMRQRRNQPEPIVVEVNPRPRQEQVSRQEQYSLPADTNLSIVKHQHDGQPIVYRNNSIPSNLLGGQSTAIGQQTKQMTQADIDEQFRDIPELGGDYSAKSNQNVERMFNFGQKTTTSSQPNQGHTFQTSKIYYNGQPSTGSYTANVSAQLGFEGQPERTTTSVIEQLSAIIEAPMSIPQRHTPSPTYFTK